MDRAKLFFWGKVVIVGIGTTLIVFMAFKIYRGQVNFIKEVEIHPLQDKALPDYSQITVNEVIRVVIEPGSEKMTDNESDQDIKYGVFIYDPKAPRNKGRPLMLEKPQIEWKSSVADLLKSVGYQGKPIDFPNDSITHFVVPKSQQVALIGLGNIPSEAILLVEVTRGHPKSVPNRPEDFK